MHAADSWYILKQPEPFDEIEALMRLFDDNDATTSSNGSTNAKLQIRLHIIEAQGRKYRFEYEKWEKKHDALVLLRSKMIQSACYLCGKRLQDKSTAFEVYEFLKNMYGPKRSQ